MAAAGDSFVVHMDRESLNDFPEMGKYDVTVTIRDFEADRLISWTILGRIRPQIGHVYGYRLEPDPEGSDGTLVTSFYDWSDIHPDWQAAGIFPVISENALRASLGILDRTVRRGYPRPVTRRDTQTGCQTAGLAASSGVSTIQTPQRAE